MSAFIQDGPVLENSFLNDPVLMAYLKARIHGSDREKIFAHLTHCGDLAAGQWLSWAKEAEAHPPVHIPYDTWGRRVDEVQTSGGWRNLEKASATEGIVATAYQKKYGDLSRLYQMSLLYLFHSSSAFVSCPLAMTDGAAYCLQKFGGSDPQLQNVFARLTSTDPMHMWMSGQWMTEKIGGSDVSQTETFAENNSAQTRLFGVKWFTSATTAQVALTLARNSDASQKSIPGSKGLSLYLVQLRDSHQRLQGIVVRRLKDKLGTKALPTAELTLEGAPAVALGGVGDGVKKITSMLNITRIYNSICAISHARRALDLAHSYASKRAAFGKRISEHPLHRATLNFMEETFQKCFALTFFVAELLGKEECQTITEEETALLRMLTPITKLYTAKQTMMICSEAVEAFGGTGYIENSGLPTLLRDAQVFSIWEGTTNILCLDFFRAVGKDQLMPVLSKWIKVAEGKIKEVYKDHSLFNAQFQDLNEAIEVLKHIPWNNEELLQIHGRKVCFSLAEVFAFLTNHKFLTARPLN